MRELIIQDVEPKVALLDTKRLFTLPKLLPQSRMQSQREFERRERREKERRRKKREKVKYSFVLKTRLCLEMRKSPCCILGG